MADHTSSHDMAFFQLLARSGSLTAAGRELRITTAAVSKRLASLEQRLGVRLAHRTARRLALTDHGQLYLGQATRILQAIEDVEDRLRGARAEPAGLLRVNATLGFGRMHIGPAIATFARRHPKVEVQLQLSASPPPIGDQAYDVGVRFGEPPDSRLVAYRLAPNRRLLCAAPGYLARAGVPQAPEDLARHNFIAIRQADEVQGLLPLKSGRRTQAVRLHGSLATNDGEVAVNWALAGLGIVLRAEWDVARYLRSGRLRPVLPDWDSPPADIFAVVPQAQVDMARVQAFVEHLRRSFAA